MTLYAAEKLIAQARVLAAEYRRTMGKPLPGISNEIAEHDAIRLLELTPKPKAKAAAKPKAKPKTKPKAKAKTAAKGKK